jgi:hypothetical protein
VGDLISEPSAFDENLPHASTPCPAWCRMSSGHTYETMCPDGSLQRYHECEGEQGVYITQEECLRDGVVILGHPVITLAECLPGADAAMTSEQVRRRAAALLNRADELDELNGTAIPVPRIELARIADLPVRTELVTTEVGEVLIVREGTIEADVLDRLQVLLREALRPSGSPSHGDPPRGHV